MTAPRPILFDLQGAQSVDHRDRGIARYVIELAVALEARAPERMAAYLLNPDLSLPSGVEPLVASGKLQYVDDATYPDGAALHLGSTVELAIPLDRLYPPRARAADLLVVATVFDLVQERFPDVYLQDAGVRRRYRARLELLRNADRLVAISGSTRDEAVRFLNREPATVDVVPLAASAMFVPAASRDGARSEARSEVPALRDRFVLYTAGSDGRKNPDGLIRAWARMPARLRAAYQLVVAGHLPPLARNHLEVLADQLDVGDRFLTTGFVSEQTLLCLNQSADLVVMPSKHEGFGFPVVEALACGTPAVGSAGTAIAELLPRSAQFDPNDADDMARVIAAALVDEQVGGELRSWTDRPRRRWTDVAIETLAAHDRADLATRSGAAPHRLRRGARHQLRIAITTPLPPQRGGVADYSARLLEHLRELADVTAFVDGPPHHREEMLRAEVPEGVTVRQLPSLPAVESIEGAFDATVYSLGNSEFHTGSLAMLRQRPGTVLAHDVRLTNLYRFATWQHPDGVPEGSFHAALQRQYGGRVPADLGRAGMLDAATADRWGIFMAADVVARSTRFLATSPFAAELARLDARPQDRPKIEVLPFSVGAVPLSNPTPIADRPNPPVIATFGVVHSRKQAAVVLGAFAQATLEFPEAKLVLVGPTSDDDRRTVERAVADAGLVGRVELTGAVEEAEYLRWLDRAWVAVQLRSSTNGESSGSIGDCLTAGVPTIITAIGPNRAIPSDVAAAVPVSAGPADVGELLLELLRSVDRRAALSAGALRYAEEHSYKAAAVALVDRLTRS